LKPLIPKRILTAMTWNTLNTAQDPAYWWNFPVVREVTLERVTGDPSLSWYTQKVRERSSEFGRTLAFGDGHGMAAEAAVTRRDTREVVYFNISEGEGRRFLSLFAEHHFAFPYRFVRGDANRFDFTSLGPFDTIISVGSFHHFENLEGIFPQLGQILKAGGTLYADEFVGPSKWKYGPELIGQLNQWLGDLPGELIRDRTPLATDEFFTLWKNGNDPSECVRSSELDASLRRHFRVVEDRHFGGTLLMPFFLTSALQPCRLNIPNWRHAELGKDTLRRLAQQEAEWIAAGKFPPHYIYYVLTKK